ncbi:Amuc_1100 family pilus-like protein [Puniceicoccaceae bacterium K14]|nr:Amuc_1100 family pilus-like protein [Puniceicoccaceae bacterium K14]
MKKNPLFYGALIVILATILVSLWYMSKQAALLANLESEYETKSRAFELYLKRSPAPTRANLEALEGNYAELYSLYERTQVALNLNTFDKELFFGEVPSSKTDSFFEIARYVESARSLAGKEEVEVFEGERFGFDTYTNFGPDLEDIETVHHQVKIMEFLVHSALKAGIREFVSIQRELPQEGGNASVVDHYSVSDLFKLDAMDATRIDGVIDSDAFRIKFSSQSYGLRNFLNQVVNSSLPFVVCKIEVGTTVTPDESAKRDVIIDSPFLNPDEGSRVMEAAQIPIIAENESEFTITIEFLKNAKTFELPESWKGETGA